MQRTGGENSTSEQALGIAHSNHLRFVYVGGRSISKLDFGSSRYQAYLHEWRQRRMTKAKAVGHDRTRPRL